MMGCPTPSSRCASDQKLPQPQNLEGICLHARIMTTACHLLGGGGHFTAQEAALSVFRS